MESQLASEPNTGHDKIMSAAHKDVTDSQDRKSSKDEKKVKRMWQTCILMQIGSICMFSLMVILLIQDISVRKEQQLTEARWRKSQCEE